MVYFLVKDMTGREVRRKIQTGNRLLSPESSIGDESMIRWLGRILLQDPSVRNLSYAVALLISRMVPCWKEPS